MHPKFQKFAKSQTITFSIVFLLTAIFQIFSIFQRISRSVSSPIVFRLSVFTEFTTFWGYENAPQLCIKIGVLIWLGWKDLNPRNNGVRVRCLTTWRHPNICTELFSFIIISLLRAIVNRKNIFLFFNFILRWKSSSSRVKMTDCRSALFAYKYIFLSYLLTFFWTASM